MRETLNILNELESQGFFERYAIGGAVAALFYIEPTVTEDLDIFVHIEGGVHPLMPMSRLFDELLRRGYKKDGIYDLIEGVPVQFLPDSPDLVKEAVMKAKTIDFEGIPTRIPSAEHLTAIMVNTGRGKDRIRALQMLEQAELDQEKLKHILERYNLLERFERWKSEH